MKCLICSKEFEAHDSTESKICPDHWRCPKCGVDAIYDDEESGRKDQQGLIDEGDGEIHCYKCNKSWSYRSFEKAAMKKAHQVVCPMCKGTGSVSEKKIK